MDNVRQACSRIVRSRVAHGKAGGGRISGRFAVGRRIGEGRGRGPAGLQQFGVCGTGLQQGGFRGTGQQQMEILCLNLVYTIAQSLVPAVLTFHYLPTPKTLLF